MLCLWKIFFDILIGDINFFFKIIYLWEYLINMVIDGLVFVLV